MPTVITVEQSPTNSSSRSGSFTDGSSTGTGVHVSPTVGSQDDSDILDETWEGVSYSDDIEPSESASRPRPSQQYRAPSRPPQGHRAPARRNTTSERQVHRPTITRVRRHPAPIASSSVDEEYSGYSRPYPPQTHQYGGPRGGQPAYAQSYASAYAPNPAPNPFGPPSNGPIVPYASHSAFQYQTHNPFSPAPAAGSPGYFPPQAHQHHMSPGGTPGYGGHEIMPYGTQSYGYPGPGQYGVPPGFYPQYMTGRDPSPPPATSAKRKDPELERKVAELEKLTRDLELSADALRREKAEREAAEKRAADSAATEKRIAEEVAKAKASKDPELEKKVAELQKLTKDLEESAGVLRKEKSEREAAEKKAADAAATDRRIAEEIAKAKGEAEAKAKAEAEKVKEESEKKAKVEADKAKAQEEALAKAQADAKALAPKAVQKPIKFKDAVGRKFSFPFHLCQTWGGMEELIRQAFLHVEVIGPHVADGHYDLVGPNGEIILPQVWDTMIEPDWAITMHMWPMPEPPKPEDRPTVIEVGPSRPHSGGRQRHRMQAPHGRDRRDRGAPPPPPSNWPPPPPPGAGGGNPAPGIIIMDGPVPRRKKNSDKSSSSILGGIFGSSKPAKKGSKGRK